VCDTTSSFFGNGKQLVYKTLKDAASDFHDLDNLRDPDKDVAISCSSWFVTRLYDQKSFASSHQNINKLRVKLATQVGMQVWLDYHLQKRRFVSIFFVPHSRPKFGMLPVWQNHLCLHQWNTDGELSRILCIQSTLKETCQQNFSVI
jgi:hypothetical protein